MISIMTSGQLVLELLQIPMVRQELLGDQTLFTIYNDAGSEENGFFNTDPLGAEIHQTVYGYTSEPGNALYDVVFIKYKIINKSDDTWIDAYISSME